MATPAAPEKVNMLAKRVLRGRPKNCCVPNNHSAPPESRHTLATNTESQSGNTLRPLKQNPATAMMNDAQAQVLTPWIFDGMSRLTESSIHDMMIDTVE